MSIVSMLELMVAVSADTTDLVRFPPPLLHLRDLGRDLGSVYLPCGLSCASRRGDLGWHPTRRGGSVVVTPHHRVGDVLVYGGELAPPARLPRRGPCSCAGPHRTAVPSTSRCPRGAAKQDVNISSEPRRVLTETQIGKIPRSKTHRVEGVVHP
jgi:hypothetical protein